MSPNNISLRASSPFKASASVPIDVNKFALALYEFKCRALKYKSVAIWNRFLASTKITL